MFMYYLWLIGWTFGEKWPLFHFNLVQNIEFKGVSKNFQKKLSDDTKKISKNDQLLIAADKTTNFYKLNPTSTKISWTPTSWKHTKRHPKR